jgi:hypothetical protein
VHFALRAWFRARAVGEAAQGVQIAA